MPTPFILDVLLVLASAVVLGEVFEQIGLPSVTGELLSGLILGPALLGIVTMGPEIEALSSISLFFIVFLIGFELRTEAVRKHLRGGVVLSITSFIAPMVAVLLVASALLPSGFSSNFVAALAIAVPSISIISVLVLQFNLLDREAGQLILASVVVTDVLAFVLLAAISQSAVDILSLVTYTTVFVAAFAAVDWGLNRNLVGFQRLLERGARFFKREDISYAILIVFGLLISFILQAIGISYVMGGFFAGLLMHDGLLGKEAYGRISRTFTRLNRGFFIPMFFGIAGLGAGVAFGSVALILALFALVAASIVPSVALTYFSAKHVLRAERRGDSPREIALILGGRGAVGVAVVTVGLNNGLVDQTTYSLAILATILISLFVLVFLRRKPLRGAATTEIRPEL